MKFKRKVLNFSLLTCLFVVIGIMTGISVKLAYAHQQNPQPQAILTLGGGAIREKFTARFAQSHPGLPIWVSSGLPQQQAYEIFQAAGISQQQFELDYRATDTVTNFTSLVKDFKQNNYQHIYIITSDFHLPRAKAIAFFVLGSHGIAYTPVAIPSLHSPEPKIKIVRDATRAIVWLITGKTGSSLDSQHAQSTLKQREI